MSSSPPPVAMPPAAPPRPRATLPLYAALAPIAGGIVLWVVTGSAISLWLAGLAPLMIAASALDGRRAARRDGRRADAERAAARSRAADEIARQHAIERGRLRVRHPDVAGYLAPDAPVWRAEAAGDPLVIGQGSRPSAVRVTGGDGDEEAVRVRQRAGILEEAPVLASAGDGIAVVGPAGVARAVVRALALQLCLALPPDTLRVDASATTEHPWLADLPHARRHGARTLALVDPGHPVPGDADAVIARVEAATPSPPGCRTVLTLVSPTEAEVLLEGEVRRIRVEAVGAAQARDVAARLATREIAVGDASGRDATIALAPLVAGAPPAATGGLPAVVGLAGPQPVVLDLVRDGPHAVVVGMTGAGKSELLVTWILALCATHTPAEVVFLLADFKGGTAFQPLADLPHVTGVLTDLDADGAHRAIESLRAELRVREAALADAGARDVSDPGVRLPRLVIVVDEFAALATQHPELLGVFTDIAARGRALGLHLVLGTQRAVGVLRDALLANCPLRICLRVTDAADSRTVVGTDAAAELPGDARGWALIRRSVDVRAQRVRIARSEQGDLERALRRGAHLPPVRRPWIPPLPVRITLAEVRVAAGLGEIVLGLADEPEHQRHAPVLLRRGERGLLLVGSAGSGKSTALALVAAQTTGSVHVVGPDLEQAWDEVDALADRSPGPDDVVLVDDVDGILTRYPGEYAHAFLERLELVVRAAGGSGGCRVVLSAQRWGGAASRLADLLPRRALLAMATRADYLTAGGDPSLRPTGGPGRAVMDGRVVQFAVAGGETGAGAAPGITTTAWDAASGVVGMVLRPGAVTHARVDALARTGVRVVRVEEARELRAELRDGSGPRAALAVVGGPEEWQREWGVLATVRERHDLVIDAGCAGEYRLVSGDRGLPPYCAPSASRGWLLRRGAMPVRTTLPAVA
ncbi:FtsK/SpoIIIE domain-containing protein [Microbacterium sp. X-17]|uniref:FtsK/SpoIIIE domain-containing protein n=1 Tax=Microbacterium sp. X-17 TaxID=3144404 RepID=UPI0031F56BDE